MRNCFVFIDRCLFRSKFFSFLGIDSVDYSMLEKSGGVGLIWSRRSSILPIYRGCTFRVYQGFRFYNLFVIKSRVGSRFGDFVLSKRIGVDVQALRRR